MVSRILDFHISRSKETSRISSTIQFLDPCPRYHLRPRLGVSRIQESKKRLLSSIVSLHPLSLNPRFANFSNRRSVKFSSQGTHPSLFPILSPLSSLNSLN